jgi:hypothetical protein
MTTCIHRRRKHACLEVNELWHSLELLTFDVNAYFLYIFSAAHTRVVHGVRDTNINIRCCYTISHVLESPGLYCSWACGTGGGGLDFDLRLDSLK